MSIHSYSGIFHCYFLFFFSRPGSKYQMEPSLGPGSLLVGRKEKNLVSCQRQSTLESSLDSFTFGVSPKMKRLRLVATAVVAFCRDCGRMGNGTPTQGSCSELRALQPSCPFPSSNPGGSPWCWRDSVWLSNFPKVTELLPDFRQSQGSSCVVMHTADTAAKGMEKPWKSACSYNLYPKPDGIWQRSPI